jgi:hypothetical protein
MKPVYDNLEEDVNLDQNSSNPNNLKTGNDKDKRAIDNPKVNRDNNNPHDKDRNFDEEDEEEDDDDFLDDGFDDDDDNDSLTDDEEYDDNPQDTKRNQKRTGTDTNP